MLDGTLKPAITLALASALAIGAVTSSFAQSTRQGQGRGTEAQQERQCWVPESSKGYDDARYYGYWGACSAPGARQER